MNFYYRTLLFLILKIEKKGEILNVGLHKKKTLAPLWVGKWTGPTRLSVLNLRDGFRWLMDFAKLLCFPHILGSRFRKIILLVKTGSRIKSKIISTIVPVSLDRNIWVLISYIDIQLNLVFYRSFIQFWQNAIV